MEVSTMPLHDQVTATARVAADGHTSSVRVEAAGTPLATAAVASDGQVVQLQFDIARGHLPTTARRELVDAVFALPELTPPRVVHAAIPLGDIDLLTLLRMHLGTVSTRAAGATCLIDATTHR
jgi:hypothetical protein